MGEVSIPRLGARLPSAAVNTAILEAFVMLGYEKPTGDQEEVILDFLKDATSSFPSQQGRASLSASPVFPFIFDDLRWHLQIIGGTDCSVSASRSLIVHLAKARTWGYSLFTCEKKDWPHCRNTQHSVAPPSCPYKFHTSLLPPVLHNQNGLPGPRKLTIVARPPFHAIAKWRPEVGWGQDYLRSWQPLAKMVSLFGKHGYCNGISPIPSAGGVTCGCFRVMTESNGGRPKCCIRNLFVGLLRRTLNAPKNMERGYSGLAPLYIGCVAHILYCTDCTLSFGIGRMHLFYLLCGCTGLICTVMLIDLRITAFCFPEVTLKWRIFPVGLCHSLTCSAMLVRSC